MSHLARHVTLAALHMQVIHVGLEIIPPTSAGGFSQIGGGTGTASGLGHGVHYARR